MRNETQPSRKAGLQTVMSIHDLHGEMWFEAKWRHDELPDGDLEWPWDTPLSTADSAQWTHPESTEAIGGRLPKTMREAATAVAQEAAESRHAGEPVCEILLRFYLALELVDVRDSLEATETRRVIPNGDASEQVVLERRDRK